MMRSASRALAGAGVALRRVPLVNVGKYASPDVHAFSILFSPVHAAYQDRSGVASSGFSFCAMTKRLWKVGRVR